MNILLTEICPATEEFDGVAEVDVNRVLSFETCENREFTYVHFIDYGQILVRESLDQIMEILNHERGR